MFSRGTKGKCACNFSVCTHHPWRGGVIPACVYVSIARAIPRQRYTDARGFLHVVYTVRDAAPTVASTARTSSDMCTTVACRISPSHNGRRAAERSPERRKPDSELARRRRAFPGAPRQGREEQLALRIRSDGDEEKGRGGQHHHPCWGRLSFFSFLHVGLGPSRSDAAAPRPQDTSGCSVTQARNESSTTPVNSERGRHRRGAAWTRVVLMKVSFQPGKGRRGRDDCGGEVGTPVPGAG